MKTVKEYAKELRPLFKGIIRMHSKEYYENYAHSEGVIDKINNILDEMEKE